MNTRMKAILAALEEWRDSLMLALFFLSGLAGGFLGAWLAFLVSPCAG